MHRLLLISLVSLWSCNLSAETIDLKCEELAKGIVQRLSEEGLLANAGQEQSKALAISLNLCNKAQVSAQKQHEDSLTEVLRDISFAGSEDRKEGNKRLLKFKK